MRKLPHGATLTNENQPVPRIHIRESSKGCTKGSVAFEFGVGFKSLSPKPSNLKPKPSNLKPKPFEVSEREEVQVQRSIVEARNLEH